MHTPCIVSSICDEGDHYYLKKMLAPKHLGLKISAPVMLLVNLSDKLVNHGLIGRVEKIEENEVQINFVLDGKNESVAISRYTFTKYDPNLVISKGKCDI
jgi:hypothetical protein